MCTSRIPTYKIVVSAHSTEFNVGESQKKSFVCYVSSNSFVSDLIDIRCPFKIKSSKILLKTRLETHFFYRLSKCNYRSTVSTNKQCMVGCYCRIFILRQYHFNQFFMNCIYFNRKKIKTKLKTKTQNEKRAQMWKSASEYRQRDI